MSRRLKLQIEFNSGADCHCSARRFLLLTTMPQGLFTQNRIALIGILTKRSFRAICSSPYSSATTSTKPVLEETNALADHYTKRGYSVSGEILYLNHLLTYVRNGKLKGLNNGILRELGAEIEFYEDFRVLSRASRRDALET